MQEYSNELLRVDSKDSSLNCSNENMHRIILLRKKYVLRFKNLDFVNPKILFFLTELMIMILTEV